MCVCFLLSVLLSVLVQHLSWIFLRIFDFISIPVGPSVGQKPSIYYGRKIIRIVAPKRKSLIISPKFCGVSFLLRSFARRKSVVFSFGFYGGTHNLWDQHVKARIESWIRNIPPVIVVCEVVSSRICYFHLYLGRWSNLIFFVQMVGNFQEVPLMVHCLGW